MDGMTQAHDHIDLRQSAANWFKRQNDRTNSHSFFNQWRACAKGGSNCSALELQYWPNPGVISYFALRRPPESRSRIALAESTVMCSSMVNAASIT